MLVSVVGVLCVALASKFWMMVTGKPPPFGTSGTDESSAYHLRLGLSSTRFHHVATLIALAHSDTQDFSIVMLTKTLGSLVGAPLMTVLWVEAIRLGGVGLGLPYFVSAVSMR
jgi:hypothetical protein